MSRVLVVKREKKSQDRVLIRLDVMAVPLGNMSARRQHLLLNVLAPLGSSILYTSALLVHAHAAVLYARFRASLIATLSLRVYTREQPRTITDSNNSKVARRLQMTLLKEEPRVRMCLSISTCPFPHVRFQASVSNVRFHKSRTSLALHYASRALPFESGRSARPEEMIPNLKSHQ